MSHRPFRFVHASDFHLETPVEGVAEVPDHLRELLLEAPYTAAERVFDTVLAEEAEFLVLSGDILHPPQTGPRGPLFLAEQFARLAERSIPVYWAAAAVDPPELWPTAIPLAGERPPCAPRPRAELIHQRDGVPLARVLVHSRDGNRLVRAGDFTPIRPACTPSPSSTATVETAGAGLAGIDYWALGGRHDRSTLFSAPRMRPLRGQPARPPARRSRHPRLHAGRRWTRTGRPARTWCRPTAFAGSASGWWSMRPPAATTWNRCFASGCSRWWKPRRTWTCWSPGRLPAAGRCVAQLRRGASGRRAFGRAAERVRLSTRRPPGACRSRSSRPAALPPEWYEQETIRGDFLRAIRQFEVNQAEPLELERYLAKPTWPGRWPRPPRWATQRPAQAVLARRRLAGRRSA